MTRDRDSDRGSAADRRRRIAARIARDFFICGVLVALAASILATLTCSCHLSVP